MAGKILIIEDNPTNLELMSYLLGAYGYAVESARNGREGVEMALRERPDLIICDLEMPEMTGYEVARKLHGNESTQGHIPMIAVTAYAMVGDRDKVLAAGFDGYLSKPIQADRFVKQVEAFFAPEHRSHGLPQAHDTISPMPEYKGDRAAILVVDDSPVNLSLIRGTLEPSGYKVTAVATVDAAMDEARRNSFDLILSDLHMPKDTGFDFLRRVKSDPNLRLIPFLVFTASAPAASEGDESQALALGADKFLLRPIEPSRLLREVEESLAKRRKDAEQKS